MQILVVVAITQMRTLRAEVGKGSMRTAIGHGLAGPKAQVKSLRRAFRLLPKGKRVKILLPSGVYFDVNRPTLQKRGGVPSRVFVPCYRLFVPEISLSCDRDDLGWKGISSFEV